jgi:DNA-binding MarR family transcriptional regulator
MPYRFYKFVKWENTIMPEQFSMQIMMRLRQIFQEMSKHSKHIQENYKITVPQLICLQEVYEHGPISIGALTKIVFLNNSTVTGIVDRLEKRELVRRNRISKDRRQVHVEITDAGIKFIQEAPKPLHRRFYDRLKQKRDHSRDRNLKIKDCTIFIFPIS